MSYMFNGCLSLSYLPQINKWDTSNVNIMSSIFSSCPSLVYLPEIDKWNRCKLTMNYEYFNDLINCTINTLDYDNGEEKRQREEAVRNLFRYFK